ncbi:RHS repeat-associated core domain-containing protein [Thiobacillus thioparus]|uniref:RHS repeat-associated core domain-containing protein n=1 Tax=Thiobacillus thioparus TaxID=931 RepID=UPI0012FB04D5
MRSCVQGVREVNQLLILLAKIKCCLNLLAVRFRPSVWYAFFIACVLSIPAVHADYVYIHFPPGDPHVFYGPDVVSAATQWANYQNTLNAQIITSTLVINGSKSEGGGSFGFWTTYGGFNSGDYYWAAGSYCPAGQILISSGNCIPVPILKNSGIQNTDQCSGSQSFPKTLIGNPVRLTTGNKYQEDLDYAWEGASSLRFIRRFNSIPGPFPLYWSYNYEQRIEPISATNPTSINVIRPDGRVYTFTFANNVWTSDADVNDRLTEQTDSSGNSLGWRYTLAADDSVETYDAIGKLLSITDRFGRTQTLAYDSLGRLARVTDVAGRQLDFTYDAINRIHAVTDPAGGVIAYGYDASGNLASVTYPDGKTKTYLYENTTFPHALTGITDENGVRYATYRYDSQGRADDEDHGGAVDHYNLAYTTDTSGNPVSTTVTDPLGTSRTYNFQTILGVVKSTGVSQPGGSGCGAASSSITYDPNGNIASRADFNGHQTCYAYDLTRNLETARVEGLASNSSCPSDPATYTPAANSAERKILTEWSTSFRLPTKLTEAGRETSTAYDGHGNVTSLSIKDTTLNKTRTWTTTYTYHASVPGVLVQKVEDGPRTDVADITTTDYYAPDETCVGDPMGCRGQVKQVTNALGHITTVNEYDANGHVLKTTDPNGLVTTFTYSPRGWLLSRTVGTETTRFDYDYVGQLTKFTRPDGSFVSFEYDSAHRLTAIVDQTGNRLTYTLDPMGNRIHEAITMPGNSTVYYAHSRTFDALGRLWQDIGATNQTITYQYDAQGNLKQMDGARTDVTDVTSHSYDALDRLTQTLNADGGIEQTTTNALDQTTQVIDPANQATSYSVNALDNVTQTQSADTGTTTRTFDAAGNLKTETDARGITVSYTYDALNRLTQKQSSQSGSPVYAYVYDSCGAGRLCLTQRNGTPDEQFTYDGQGRLASRLTAGTSGATGYAYRPGGQIATLTYPTGRSVTYSYDAEGRIIQVSTQPQSGTPVTVLANNFLSGYPFASTSYYMFYYGNGTWTWQYLTLDYRPSGRVDGSSNSGTGAYTKSCSYDPSGNITGMGDNNGTGINYAYDATGRLVSAVDSASNGFGSLGYSYDKNGNRTVETRNASNLSYVYNPPGSNWLYQRGSDTRIKSPNGNTLSSAAGSFAYDGFNRLVTSQTAAETTTYTYNALGERIKKINQNGLSTVFHYGPDGELLYEQDQAGNTKAYVWLDGRPLARIDNNAQIYYYHVDHLGTPWAMTDQSGTTVWKANYEPFGKATVTVSTVTNNLRLPGQYYDRETGLHYNYARDYDPTTGRYIEADPIGLDGGMNLYGYANQNPLLFTDPTGTIAIADDVIIGGVIIAGAAISSPAGQKAISDTITAVKKFCERSDDCEKLYADIDRLVNQLQRRNRQLRENRGDLPITGPNSIEGHRQKFRDRQAELRDKLNQANAKGCVNYRPDAWNWATVIAPYPIGM